jgi:hypothetical protein
MGYGGTGMIILEQEKKEVVLPSECDLSIEIGVLEAEVQLALLMLETLNNDVEMKPIGGWCKAVPQDLGPSPTEHFLYELFDRSRDELKRAAARAERLGKAIEAIGK